MKLSKYFAFLAFAALSFTSCNSFLDKAPENSVPETSVDFANLDNLYQPVSGVYAKVRTGAMHWVIYPQIAVRDDDMWSGRTDDQQLLVNIGKYQYDNTFWGLNEMWNQYYGIIKTANAALVSLEEYSKHMTTASQLQTYRSYCGEVRFLRAWTYYMLTRTFGDVTILRDNKQGDLTRSTRAAVYHYMLEDLNFAYQNCEKKRPNQMEHAGAVTAYTAEALAAKVYMEQNDYQKALDATNDIIQNGHFTLYNNYAELFKIPGKLSDESLFEVQTTDFGTGAGEMVDADQWFVFQNPGSMGGWNFMRFYPAFYQWAQNRGETVRLANTFLQGGTTTAWGDAIGGSTTEFYNAKVYTPRSELTPGRTKPSANNNIRLMRYADVLLINAEAKVRLGQNGDATFNLVRARAAMPAITGVTLDQIIDERRMEFAGEWGERYNDLIRTGKAASVLQGNPNKSGWTTDKTYFPLPFNQLDQVPALKNTPKNN